MVEAHIVADTYSGRYLPICYAEFSSAEHAQHTLDTAGGAGGSGLSMNGATVSISFAASGKTPSASSSETALKAFQQRQSAMRLAELESADVARESRERDEAREQVCVCVYWSFLGAGVGVG